MSEITEEIEPEINELIARAEKGLQALLKQETLLRAKLDAQAQGKSKGKGAAAAAMQSKMEKVDSRRLKMQVRQRERLEAELRELEEECERLVSKSRSFICGGRRTSGLGTGYRPFVKSPAFSARPVLGVPVVVLGDPPALQTFRRPLRELWCGVRSCSLRGGTPLVISRGTGCHVPQPPPGRCPQQEAVLRMLIVWLREYG